MAIGFAISRKIDQKQAFRGQDRLKWQLDLPFYAKLTIRKQPAAFLFILSSQDIPDVRPSLRNSIASL
ncbi:MAG: hypothetical protein QM296_03340 [Bacillota bacterium]|nr:hypothetical protein [Bacillota bacterium]